MSFNGSGTFQINTAGQPVVTGTTITSTAFNALTADLATGLSTCITKDGQTTPTANIPMGNNKITGMAAGTAATDAANLSQAQSTATKLLSVSGTDTITASGSPTVAAYSTGAMYYFSPAATNTGAVTINIDSLGAKAITKNGSTALAAGDLTSGKVAVVVYDGTQFQLINAAGTGNITFSSNTIGTSVTNQDMLLVPNGTGRVYINGLQAGPGKGSSNTNTVFGSSAGNSLTSGTYNIAIGYSAGINITSGSENICIGYAGDVNLTTASSNIFVGHFAGSYCGGTGNTGIGRVALGTGGSGNYNSALGYQALTNSAGYTNATGLGYGTDVTGSNQIQIGNSSTTTYVYGTVQNRSDLRDKTDIQDTDLGLNFIMALKPRKFKWDMRDDYKPPMPDVNTATPEELEAWRQACNLSNITHDGSKTRSRYHYGLIAQEVKATMDNMSVDFGGYQDHSIKGGQDVKSIGYNEMIAPLIKAIQELKAEFDAYKAAHP